MCKGIQWGGGGGHDQVKCLFYVCVCVWCFLWSLGAIVLGMNDCGMCMCCCLFNHLF